MLAGATGVVPGALEIRILNDTNLAGSRPLHAPSPPSAPLRSTSSLCFVLLVPGGRYGIDYLHHHITDGHVAHHLFFTQIPHYNLPIATEGIRKYVQPKP